MIHLYLLYGIAMLETLRRPIHNLLETISDHPFLSAILFTLLTWFGLVIINISMLTFVMFPWYIAILIVLGFAATTFIVAKLFDKFIKGELI